MSLTERQKVIAMQIAEFDWKGNGIDVTGRGDEWLRRLAVQIDQAIPALPVPTAGHLPAIPAAPMSGGRRWTTPLGIQVVIDLDNFYEDVVMPARELYMAKNEGRRAGDASAP